MRRSGNAANLGKAKGKKKKKGGKKGLAATGMAPLRTTVPRGKLDWPRRWQPMRCSGLHIPTLLSITGARPLTLTHMHTYTLANEQTSKLLAICGLLGPQGDTSRGTRAFPLLYNQAPANDGNVLRGHADSI